MEINRNIFNKLYEDIGKPFIDILIGPRQVGKTFLLKKIYNEALKIGLKTRYFDLEQPDHLIQFNKGDKEIINSLFSGCDLVIVDEFHYLKNASKIFKAIYDSSSKVKIFASGSSSIEIHKHIKESLVGRKRVYYIYPCSFNEFASIFNGDFFNEYCVYGGLPGLIHCEDHTEKVELLKEILQSYLLKDIKALIREENIRAYNHLLYFIAQNQGSVLSISSLAREVGLTNKTIENYFEIMSQTFVNFQISSYGTNLANELKKSKKYYLYDLGIRNILLKDFRNIFDRDDLGHIAESFVFLELNKRLTPECELRFWRTKEGSEVDFILVKNRIAFPIEVKTTCRMGEIPSGLAVFLKRYPKTKKAFVLARNVVGEFIYNGIPIHYLEWKSAGLVYSMVEM